MSTTKLLMTVSDKKAAFFFVIADAWPAVDMSSLREALQAENVKYFIELSNLYPAHYLVHLFLDGEIDAKAFQMRVRERLGLVA